MVVRSTVSRAVNTSVRNTLGSGGGASGGGGPSYDTDAQAYFTAVEAEDGEALESGVKDAINAFVVGCKDDGIWDAIKASCILAGARTLDGALVPLVGTAPTSINFVSGDYSRTAGMTGNGATKCLLVNKSVTDQPRNNRHIYAYISAVVGNGCFIGAVPSGNVDLSLRNFNSFYYDASSSAQGSESGFTYTGGGYGTARNSGTEYHRIAKSVVSTVALSSGAPQSSRPYSVLAAGGSTQFSGSTVCFYSCGDYVNLETLDSRVLALMTAIGAVLA